MRYTTVIDISENKELYRNKNCRLLYLHMALKCGYHDEDRDQLDCSLRNLAYAVGITLSACRHALARLQSEGLIEREGELWRVKKWVKSETITSRKQQNTARNTASGGIDLRKHEAEMEEYRRKQLEAVKASTKEELIAWLEELDQGRNLIHHGVYLGTSKAVREWLTNYISKL